MVNATEKAMRRSSSAVYDDVLTMNLPNDIRLVAFADELAAVITVKTEDLATEKVRQVASRVRERERVWRNMDTH